jgi:FAD/FMN-containing dehydrogenase
VVKNVTGYDLHKLMIGSYGTLGVITKINFRTFPLPKSSRALVALFGSAENASKMRDSIAQSPFGPLTLDILSPQVAKLFTNDAASRIEPKPFRADVLSSDHWALTTGFSGNEAVLERYLAGLTALAKKAGAQHISLLDESELPGALGRKREFVPIALSSFPAATILRMSVVPTRIYEILEKSTRAAESNQLPWAALARGVGAIYFALLLDLADEECRVRIASTCEQLMTAVDAIGGNCTIAWCPAKWKQALRVWGTPRPDFPLMKKLKGAFDPSGVLSPGRFMGGL